MTKIILFCAFVWSNLAFGQKPEIIKIDDLQRIISEKSDNIQIINFWATWCGPCVKELPFFEKLTAEGRKDIKVTLVSMDLELNPDPEKVYKFVSRKNIQSQVVLLDEADPNSWINSIEKQWSGALPATLLINQNTGARKFIGRELKEGDLEMYLKQIQ